MLELRQLKYFLAVADARSFVSAADRLFVSRQAVSKSISQLEKELNVELFMRDSNGSFLTPAGVMLYDRVHSSVNELERLRTEMQEYGSRYRQRIRLVFAPGVTALYEEALQRFQAKNSNLTLEYSELQEHDCTGLLLEHKADLAISTALPQDPLLLSEPLLTSPYGFLHLSGKETASLWQQPVACFAEDAALQCCRSHGITPAYVGCDYFRLFSLTAAGQCALLLPQRLVPDVWPQLCWTPLSESADWNVYCCYLRLLDANILYRTVLDELLLQVFDLTPGKGGALCTD